MWFKLFLVSQAFCGHSLVILTVDHLAATTRIKVWRSILCHGKVFSLVILLCLWTWQLQNFWCWKSTAKDAIYQWVCTTILDVVLLFKRYIFLKILTAFFKIDLIFAIKCYTFFGYCSFLANCFLMVFGIGCIWRKVLHHGQKNPIFSFWWLPTIKVCSAIRPVFGTL